MDSIKLKSALHRPPVVLSGLLLLTIVGFLAVNRLVHKFQHHEQDLARAMFQAGQRAREAGNPQAAIADFRAALSYARDNYQYQLNLAKALAAAGRFEEAESYLVALWEHAPQDGDLNLQLARLAARRDAMEEALRHYHSAIYGLWDADPDGNRRKTRIELVNFLLRHNDHTQAQAELIAMAAALPADSELHSRVADLFVQAQDFQHAFDEYGQALKINPKDADALAGAGQSAYELGQYASAERYLRGALEENPQYARSAALLKTASLILENDPFRRRIAEADRSRRLLAAFQQAGDRLQSCIQSRGLSLTSEISPSSRMQLLYVQWQSWKAKLDQGRFRPDPNAADSLMDLVGDIEQQTQPECGPPSGLDLALLLIARNRDGGDR